MRTLYTLIMQAAAPFVCLRLFFKGIRNRGYWRNMPQRFGFIPKMTEPCLWVHAVSVGESMAILPLLRQLKASLTHPLLVTNTTPTGAQIIQKALGNSVTQAFLPFDTPGAVHRFLNRSQPRLLVLIETELWPNLIHHCHKRNIPIALLNARLSARSARGYARIHKLLTPTLRAFTAIAAQSPEDAARFMALGADPASVSISGNIKFDITLSPPPETQTLKQQLNTRQVVTIASTHDPEETLLLSTYHALKPVFPNLLFVIVPRHPERFARVLKALTQTCQVTTRSSGLAITQNTDVFLGDSLGEMPLYYAIAQIAFVGGSFAPIGGHNVLEPLSLGIPTITGPHTQNFRAIMQHLTQNDAIWVAQTPDELMTQITTLLQQPTIGHTLATNAQRALAANQGALQRQYRVITTILHKTGATGPMA